MVFMLEYLQKKYQAEIETYNITVHNLLIIKILGNHILNR